MTRLSQEVIAQEPMFHVVLYQPEIPPNTGNIIRLCANTGTWLHLIRPLGFELTDSRLRRAGMDYREFATVREHASLDQFTAEVAPRRLFALTTKAQRHYDEVEFADGDSVLFGPETRGLPSSLLTSLAADRYLRIPMVADSRSLNLSNAVAVVVYEAWRQRGFPNAC